MKRPFIFPVVFSGVILLPGTLNAQWVQTAVPPAGVLALTANGGNLFAGTSGSGVFLTANNGTSWAPVNSGLTNLNVYALAANGGNLFAGTGGGGVFLTTNNGTSWAPVNSGLTNLNVYALTANGGDVFAGTGGGVFLTTNNGTSWAPVNSGLTNLTVYALGANGGNIFAGTGGGGVFLTTNNGTSWTSVSNGLTNGTIMSLAANGGNLFAGTQGGGVFLTTNNGTSWSAINSGLTNSTISSLAASGGNIFAGTIGGGVFLTTNNGTSWIDFNAGLTILGVPALAVSGSNLFAGVLGSPGVWRRPLSDVANLPAAPTLSSPANAATNVALSPTMIWNAVTGATTYRLQVSTSSSFSTTIFNDSTLTGTSRAIGPLIGATVYYWRVRAKNSYGTGNWSSIWSFTTIWSPPAAPVLSSPADGATIVVPSPTTFWNTSSGAASYTLNMSAASDFSTIAVNQSNIISTSQKVSGLSNNTTYYWRVNASNPAGTSLWSNTWSFTMAFDTTWRCLAHWSFDSTSDSTFYDVTGHGYDAHATGTGYGLVPGVIGQALNCSEDTGHEITVANSSNDFYLSKFSIECWFYSNVNPSQNTSEGKILDYQYITWGTRNGYTMDMTPSGAIRFGFSNADESAWVLAATPSATIQAATWYHLVCTYDSAYIRIYVDSVLSGNLAYQGTYPPPNNNAHIGYQKRTTGENYYYVNGRIDELKLYNYALPADSVAAHYIQSAIKPTQKIPSFASTLKIQARNSLLTISLPSAMQGKAVDLTVYTASGREVVRRKVQNGAERFTVPVPGLALGAYVLAVKEGSKKITARFVFVR